MVAANPDNRLSRWKHCFYLFSPISLVGHYAVSWMGGDR